ncbi:hypothetical protein OAQ87_02385 [Candidatus Marinimicrobia bacterium]|nr:hypothetical protein [Candidatus Neomarinimicrobiota bacterium]
MINEEKNETTTIDEDTMPVMDTHVDNEAEDLDQVVVESLNDKKKIALII